MENQDLLAVGSAESNQVVYFDDVKTFGTIRAIKRFERAALIVLSILAVLGVFYRYSADVRHGIFFHVIVVGAIYFAAIVCLYLFVIGPLRIVLFPKCARDMRKAIQKFATTNKWSAWYYPYPGIIALDMDKKFLYVEGHMTDYHVFRLAPWQIIDAKIEREQTLNTTTHHSPRMTYTTSFGLGFIGGGRSTSTTKVSEAAFLEISFRETENALPERLVLPFGESRRDADDWILALQLMCRP